MEVIINDQRFSTRFSCIFASTTARLRLHERGHQTLFSASCKRNRLVPGPVQNAHVTTGDDTHQLVTSSITTGWPQNRYTLGPGLSLRNVVVGRTVCGSVTTRRTRVSSRGELLPRRSMDMFLWIKPMPPSLGEGQLPGALFRHGVHRREAWNIQTSSFRQLRAESAVFTAKRWVSGEQEGRRQARQGFFSDT